MVTTIQIWGKEEERRRFEPSLVNTTEDLPSHWQHLRISYNKVRPEYYRTADLLVSKYHCSVEQATAAIVETGRIMLNIPWKFHNEGDTFDLTLLLIGSHSFWLLRQLRHTPYPR